MEQAKYFHSMAKQIQEYTSPATQEMKDSQLRSTRDVTLQGASILP
jgi:hypothetical protein